MAYRKEELVEVPHFRDGETFSFHVPYNLDELDCKLDSKARYNELPWSPWPDQKHIERQVGSFVLKLHPTLTRDYWIEGHYVKKNNGQKVWVQSKRTQVPHRLIRRIDEPDNWKLYVNTWSDNDFVKKTGLESFFGRHVLSIVEQDFPELGSPRNYNNKKAGAKVVDLRTPTPIDKEILKKVYGRSHPRVETHTNYEFADLGNQFQLELEWFRKNLLKIQRKRANKAKKAKAKELGVTVEDINEQKRQEREMAKQVQYTQEWLSIAPEVHKCKEFLDEVIKQMGQRERLDREWYDKGRRHMRELANTMRPLNKHFPKKK